MSGTTSLNDLGIDDRTHERDWDLLTDNTIREVLTHYGAANEPLDILWHSPRAFSSAALAALPKGEKIFIKRHDPELRPAPILQEEHDFIVHLKQNNFPVLSPLINEDGKSITVTESGVFELYPPMPGQDLYKKTLSWEPYHSQNHAFSAGTLLARLHKASADYKAPPRQTRFLAAPLSPLLSDSLEDCLTEWISKQAGLETTLQNWNWKEELFPRLEKFHAPLRPLLDHISPQWGHGDWHGSNLVWRNNESVAAFDFGLSDKTCSSFDIAIALERSFIRWMDCQNHNAVAFALMTPFLCGYHRESPISEIEKRLVSLFLPLAHVTFALSEIAYYNILARDRTTADIAYRKYLIGHLDWFSGPYGQSCLSKLDTVLGSLLPI